MVLLLVVWILLANCCCYSCYFVCLYTRVPRAYTRVPTRNNNYNNSSNNTFLKIHPSGKSKLFDLIHIKAQLNIEFKQYSNNSRSPHTRTHARTHKHARTHAHTHTLIYMHLLCLHLHTSDANAQQTQMIRKVFRLTAQVTKLMV